MGTIEHRFTARLWAYQGKGAWHFVTVPGEAASEIRFHNPLLKGFAPVSCHVTIGRTRWKTALFPDSKSGSYLIAIKAEVRKAEGIAAGDTVHVTLSSRSEL
jgi:hypothetical protein